MKKQDLNEIIKIIPKDKFYGKRIKNLSNASDKEIYYYKGKVASIVFVNKFLFIKLVTWISNPNLRRRGFASVALNKLKKRHNLLFAKIQKGNRPSYKFVIKNGFKKLIYIPGVVCYPGTLFYWVKN